MDQQTNKYAVYKSAIICYSKCVKFALQLADVETEESEGMKVLQRIMKRVWFPRITADINTEKEKICDKIGI